MTITNDILTLAAIVAAMVGVFKTMGLSSKYSPLAALAVAAIFVLVPGDWQTQLITICVIGLSAAGVYHYSTNSNGADSLSRASRPYPLTMLSETLEPAIAKPKRKYALRPDLKDKRDYVFTPHPVLVAALPASIDLRTKMPPIMDQGQLGSCAENAYAAFLEYLMMQAGEPLTTMSRLDLYYKVREIEGTITQDAGSMLRDVFKVGQQRGVAPEIDYPYVITDFKNPPSAQAEADAGKYKIFEYHRVLTYNDMKVALANGQPVQIGFTVYDSFESFETANGGVVATPDQKTESVLGGHSILLAGYNPSEHPGEVIIGRNSWGGDWGDHGYCYLPKSYWDNGIVTDMWTATLTKPLATTDNVSLLESLNYYAGKGAIDNPVDPVWLTLIEKIKAGTATAEDYRFMPLLFQKVAVFDMNSGL